MGSFRKTFVLLILVFGCVGLERFVAAFVLPGIQKDFALNYAQAGSIIGVFAIAWAVGVWAMGSVSDYIGRKPVIVVLTILGGILSWLSGIAGGLASLLVIRGIMGFVGGAYGLLWQPPSVKNPRHWPGLVTSLYPLPSLSFLASGRPYPQHPVDGSLWLESRVFLLCRTFRHPGAPHMGGNEGASINQGDHRCTAVRRAESEAIGCRRKRDRIPGCVEIPQHHCHDGHMDL